MSFCGGVAFFHSSSFLSQTYVFYTQVNDENGEEKNENKVSGKDEEEEDGEKDEEKDEDKNKEKDSRKVKLMSSIWHLVL